MIQNITKILLDKFTILSYNIFTPYNRKVLADVAELEDALDLGSSAARRAGSTPVIGMSCLNNKTCGLK